MIACLELKEAEERLSLRTIKSPVNGVVAACLLGSAEYVGENPILTIARIDPLYVEVVAPVAFLGQIRLGAKATVFPEAPVGSEHTADVIVVDKVVDAASGTFGVRLKLRNKGYKLPAGLKCRVVF